MIFLSEVFGFEISNNFLVVMIYNISFRIHMEKQIIIVGDIHGCVDEFKDLLNKISFNSNQIRLILVGDILDRGPDPVACLRLAQELDVECVKGNHEDKSLRWVKHFNKCRETGAIHPMKAIDDKTRKEYLSLNEDDLNWMKRLPTAISIDAEKKWIAVHAGVEPRKAFNHQVDAQLMRARYMNSEGRAVSLGPTLKQPEGSKYWAEMWTGAESFIFGHNVFTEPTFFKREAPTKHSEYAGVGIDTGACFGGSLTALFYPSMEIVQVKAKKVYFENKADAE